MFKYISVILKTMMALCMIIRVGVAAYLNGLRNTDSNHCIAY